MFGQNPTLRVSKNQGLYNVIVCGEDKFQNLGTWANVINL